MFEAARSAFGLLLSGDPVLWAIIWISVKTSVGALVLAAPLAVGIGYAIASCRFRGRRVVIWLVQATLSLPTVLVGLLLYLLLSRHGLLGGLHLLFT
jgi:tungstate transport system permease protein